MLKLDLYVYFYQNVSAYRTDFDETKYMYFLIKDDELLEKYNEILEKVKNSIKKEFVSEPVINEKYLKAKYLKYLIEGSQYICLPLILIDSVFRSGKIYYPQVLLEECKCEINIEISSDSDRKNSDQENSNEENSNEENSDEENFDEEN